MFSQPDKPAVGPLGGGLKVEGGMGGMGGMGGYDSGGLGGEGSGGPSGPGGMGGKAPGKGSFICSFCPLRTSFTKPVMLS